MSRYEKVVKEVGTRQPLNERERKIIETLLNEYPEEEHVARVVAYANADFTDEEDAPSGMLTVHSLDAPVQPDSLPDQMFQYLVICPVKNDNVSDADFVGKEAKLQENIVQHAETPPSLQTRNSENRDVEVWDAELGGEGAFAGIFKKGRMNHGDHDDQYFVVVKAGAPLACRQFKDELVASKEPITFRQLFDDSRFAYVKNLAQRNAERLAYQTARSLGLRVQHVQDMSAKTQGAHIAVPFKACPPLGYHQTITVVKPIVFKGKQLAAVYHELRPTDEGSNATFVNAGPYNGLVIFQMRGTGHGFALPTSTGRKKIDDPLNYANAERRARNITWEGKEKDIRHPDLHPEAFHSVDNHFLEAMKKVGWQQTGVDNRVYLLPVLVKIANPALKRKI